jgi:hypothetical protein
MSALPPKADIGRCRFRSEPVADIDSITSSARVGPLFARLQKDQKLWIFMEGKLALLYLIFMLIITIAYVEVSPTKLAKPSPIVARIQAASE